MRTILNCEPDDYIQAVRAAKNLIKTGNDLTVIEFEDGKMFLVRNTGKSIIVHRV